MTFWRSPTFKALQKDWYQRLANEGFEDAEELIGEEMTLRQSAAHPLRHSSELGIITKEAYYRFLGQNIQEFTFSSEVDKIILTLFAEGAKIRKIGEELAKVGEARCRGTIRYTIRKYEMVWGLRAYSLKQLNRKQA